MTQRSDSSPFADSRGVHCYGGGAPLVYYTIIFRRSRPHGGFLAPKGGTALFSLTATVARGQEGIDIGTDGFGAGAVGVSRDIV